MGDIVLPSCPKLKTLSIFFDLIQLWGRSWPDLIEPGLQFDGEWGYFPALKVLTVKIFGIYGSLEYFERYQIWPVFHALLREVFPAESVVVLGNLGRLRVTRNWEAVEENIRALFPPQLQIIYDEEEEE